MIHIEDKWKGKWVLVTGGADRVGRMVCEAFAKGGYNIVIHARTDRPSQHELARYLEEQYGVRTKLVTAELTNKAEVEAMFGQCSQLDVVVSNAAAYEVDPDADDKNLKANKIAQQLVVAAAVDYARAHQQSMRIIITGDAHLGRGNRYGEHLRKYEKSKLWVHEDIDQYAELGDEGITIVGVLPGPVLHPTDASTETIDTIAKQIPMSAELKNPWIGEWYARGVVAVANAGPALHASCVFLDGGRDFEGEVPKEH